MLEFLSKHKKKLIAGLVIVVLLALVTNKAEAAEADRAPLGVTQERLLSSGDVEPFYTYENAKFNGSASSSHGFGVMLGLADFLTVGASTAYVDGLTENGVGDFFVFGTLDAGNLLGLDIRPSLGVVIPNGFDQGVLSAVEVSDGSYSLQPSLALVGDLGPFGVGAQYVGVFRLDDNDNGTRLGDENTVKAWASSTLFNNVVLFAAAEANFVESTSGLAFADGSENVLLGGGARVTLAGFEVAGEVYFPVYEKFDLASANDQRVFRLGVQRSF